MPALTKARMIPQDAEAVALPSETRPAATARSQPVRTTGFRWQVVLAAAIIALWEGVPLMLIGFRDDSYGPKIIAGLALLSIPVHMVRRAMGKARFNAFNVAALVLVLWCFAVSAYYSNVIEPKPANQWVQSGYVVLPILLIFTFQAARANVSDIERGIVLAGTLGSLIAILDHSLSLELLKFFHRPGSDGQDRIVFFKLPALFTFIIAIARIYSARGPITIATWAVVSVITIYNVVVLTESRLALGGILIALGLIAVFVTYGNRRTFLVLTGLVAAVPVSAFVVNKYFANFTSLDAYFRNDISAWFRGEEIKHFAYLFSKTDGLGFGFMSLNPDNNNILTFAAYKQGYIIGTGENGPVLTDIGLYSALYQFGYVGLALILSYTLWTGSTLIRARRFGRAFAPTAAVGCLFISLLISPIAINYFTVQWAAHVGALVFFMASECPGRFLSGNRGRRLRVGGADGPSRVVPGRPVRSLRK